MEKLINNDADIDIKGIYEEIKIKYAKGIPMKYFGRNYFTKLL